jgi:hypothetical protein
LSLFAGWLHLQQKYQPTLCWFKNAESRLNHHLSALFGVSSLAWAGLDSCSNPSFARTTSRLV